MLGPGVRASSSATRSAVIPAFSLNQYGVYGELAIVPASCRESSRPASPGGQAAAVWMQYLTAYGALIEHRRGASRRLRSSSRPRRAASASPPSRSPTRSVPSRSP